MNIRHKAAYTLDEELRSLGLLKRALFTTYMSKMMGRFYDAERHEPRP